MFELHLTHETAVTATSASPIGACPDCGQMRYAGLTHHCGTHLAPGQVAAPQQPIMLPAPANFGAAWVEPAWSFDLSGAATAA